ncbi:hypothetical protein CDO29_34700 (plasmid) [Sinorhizobium meliloti]|nr:hypothetical protein CDO29_34700 [Sinorhizobium meliloti]
MSIFCSRRTEAGERLLVSAGAPMSRSVELQADLKFRAFLQFIDRGRRLMFPIASAVTANGTDH